METAMSEVDEPRVYTVPQVARMAGVSRSFMYELIARGEIPGVIALGQKIVLSKPAIDAMLDPVDEPELTRAAS